MESAPGASGSGEGPFSSPSPIPAATTTCSSDPSQLPPLPPPPPPPPTQQPPSRYESQKRRDWNTFLQYLKNHKPPLSLSRCSGAHVIEFLKYLDQFGKTKVHASGCSFFGHPNPPSPCACPLKQAWGSLDALIGRLRAAYEENGGRPESNPFGARAVRIYLREVRESQAKARGIPYEKKKRKRLPSGSTAGASSSSSAHASGGADKGSGSEATVTTSTTTTTFAVAATAASGATVSSTSAGGTGGEGSGAPPPRGSSPSS